MPNFSIQDILANSLEQRRRTMEPAGWQTAIPAAAGLVNKGFELAEQQKKKLTLMQAQQDASNFLSLSPEERDKPENKTRGFHALIAMGVDPTPYVMAKAVNPLKAPDSLEMIQKKAEARAKGTAAGTGQTLSDDVVGKAAKEIAAGADSALIAKSYGRAAYKFMPKIMEEAYKLNPSLKIQTNALDYQTKQAMMKTNMGSTVQLPARKIAAILPRIDSAVEASNKIPRSSIQFINKVGIAAAAKTGNREAQDLLNKAKLVADEFQATIGAGSDSKLDLAMDLLNTSQTVEQFQDAARNMKEAMQARREAILTGNVPAAPKSGATPTSNPNSLSSGIDAL